MRLLQHPALQFCRNPTPFRTPVGSDWTWSPGSKHSGATDIEPDCLDLLSSGKHKTRLSFFFPRSRAARGFRQPILLLLIHLGTRESIHLPTVTDASLIPRVNPPSSQPGSAGPRKRSHPVPRTRGEVVRRETPPVYFGSQPKQMHLLPPEERPHRSGAPAEAPLPFLLLKRSRCLISTGCRFGLVSNPPPSSASPPQH